MIALHFSQPYFRRPFEWKDHGITHLHFLDEPVELASADWNGTEFRARSAVCDSLGRSPSHPNRLSDCLKPWLLRQEKELRQNSFDDISCDIRQPEVAP